MGKFAKNNADDNNIILQAFVSLTKELSAIHAKDIAHDDFREDNIIIEKTPHSVIAHIVDFGNSNSSIDNWNKRHEIQQNETVSLYTFFKKYYKGDLQHFEEFVDKLYAAGSHNLTTTHFFYFLYLELAKFNLGKNNQSVAAVYLQQAKELTVKPGLLEQELKSLEETIHKDEQATAEVIKRTTRP